MQNLTNDESNRIEKFLMNWADFMFSVWEILSPPPNFFSIFPYLDFNWPQKIDQDEKFN